ncbi:hypothetical protein A0U40_14070 [[Bacillus] sp. KCTC 13219]|nr:hypothetical protein A0U40_14070 [[Bacillus] sp. KCTC 13219]
MSELKNRDIKLSNIKGVLIFLVVFGHVMELYKREFNELFVFLYSFHMPLFIVISGYFAKKANVKKVVNFLFMYLIFQTIFNVVYYLIGKYQVLEFHYDTPIFHLWYVVSMIFWYIAAVGISKLKLSNIGKVSILLTITSLSFISRWYANDIELLIREFYPNFTTYTLSYQRTITFAPFFMLGFFLNTNQMKRISSGLNTKFLPYLLLITTFLGFYFANRYPVVEMIYRGSFGINKFLETKDLFIYTIHVTLHYGSAIWISILLLNFIDDKERIFTKWGDNSLTIFLFHPIFVFILWKFEFFLDWNIATKLMLFLCITICITFILGSNRFVKLTKPLCQPYFYISRILKSKQ